MSFYSVFLTTYVSSFPSACLPQALFVSFLQSCPSSFYKQSTQSQKCKAGVLIPALWLLIGVLQMGKLQEPVPSGQKSMKSLGLLGVLFSCTSLSIRLFSYLSKKIWVET